MNTLLAQRPSGCVVWDLYTERVADHRLDLPYLWLGGAPRQHLVMSSAGIPRSKTPQLE